jgi:hypothetical protein
MAPGSSSGIPNPYADETNASHIETRASHAESASQSSADPEYAFDDFFDFPPTAHPDRELFSASLFVVLMISLLVWGGWKLFSLL